MATRRQRLVFDTFVELADTLASDYDIGEFLQFLVHRCADLLLGDTAGVLLEGPGGDLRLAAATSDEMRRLEDLEVRLRQGPCTEAYRRAEPVIAEDLVDYQERWPQVTPKLMEMGMRSAHAFPVRLRADCIGAINLYRVQPGPFHAEDVRLGQALADVAAIGILQERKIARAERVADQLQLALSSRIVIEQAKGILAERHGISTADAFGAISNYSRSRNRKLREVCQEIVDGRYPFKPR
jgi:GAF domain-containing protein